jgi:hypothetical protein
VDHPQIDSRTVEGTNKEYLQSIIDTYGDRQRHRQGARARAIPVGKLAAVHRHRGGHARRREREIVESAILPSTRLSSGSTMRASETIECAGDPAGPDARSRPWKRGNGANFDADCRRHHDAMRQHRPTPCSSMPADPMLAA